MEKARSRLLVLATTYENRVVLSIDISYVSRRGLEHENSEVFLGHFFFGLDREAWRSMDVRQDFFSRFMIAFCKV